MAYVLRVNSEACNNSCSFCPATGRRFCPTALTDVLAQLKAIPTSETVLIRGGEPTLHKDFFSIVQAIRDSGFRSIVLETNGRMMFYPDFTRRIAEIGIKQVRPYLLGATPGAHDRITQVKGSFDQTSIGMKTASRYGLEAVPLGIIMETNTPSIEEWKCLFKSMDVHSVSFLYLSSDYGHYNPHLTGLDFFGDISRKLYTLIDELKGEGIAVLPNEYENSVQFHNLYKDLRIIQERPSKPKSKVENKQLNLKEFNEGRLVLQSYPQKIYVELTQNCNFRCVMCARPTTGDYNPQLDMPFDTFKNVADELFPFADYVDLRGWGETTILRDWERKYLDYALTFRCKFGLITNLSVRNDRMWETLVKHNFFLGVSFDGATKETFETIRKGAKFETILHNLRLVSDLMKIHRSPPENLKLMMTVQELNVREIPDVVELAGEVGVKSVQLSPCRVMFGDEFGGKDLVFENKPLIKAILEEALEKARKHGIELLMTGTFNVPEIESRLLKQRKIKKNGCYNPWSRVYVTPEGKIGPCNHLMYPTQVLLGDIKEGFWRAWNSLDFQLFRHMICTQNKNFLCDYCFKSRYGD